MSDASSNDANDDVNNDVSSPTREAGGAASDVAVTSPAAGRGFSRLLALLVSVTLVALTLWPALRDPPQDSFPLSTYPMFSTVRKTAWIHVIVGFDAAGNEHKIPPQLVANIEVMQAAQTIRQAIRRKRAKQLCEEVAARVQARPRYAEVVRLEVQSRRFDPLTYFMAEDGRTPSRTKRRARCALPGNALRKGSTS